MSLVLIKCHAMKIYRKWKCLHYFLILSLDGCEWSVSHLFALTLKKGSQPGMSQSWSQHSSWGKDFWPLPGIKPYGSSGILVLTLTVLCSLFCTSLNISTLKRFYVSFIELLTTWIYVLSSVFAQWVILKEKINYIWVDAQIK